MGPRHHQNQEDIGMELDRTDVYVGGQWRPASASETITVVNPSTEQVLATVPSGDATDVDAAVTAARHAFDAGPWGSATAEERAEVMERLADEIEKRADAMTTLVSREIGQPLEFSRAMSVLAPAGFLRYYAQVARERPVEEERPALTWKGHSVIRKEPVGVVGLIVPWNFPQVLALSKLAPALAAGCTVVLKPAAESPLDAYLLAEAVEAAGLPPGVFNLVPGGRETGEALVRHPLVDKIAFTGSTAAGRKIGAICGELLRPVTLELGGKSAAVILDDADLGVVLESLRVSAFLNSGQTCFLLSRVLAPRSTYDAVVDGLAQVAREFVLGDPLDPATTMGPLVSGRQRDRVEGYLARAVSDGARLVAGGGRPAELDRGYFVQPTVFADVDNHSVLGQEEVFGPVVAVMPYDDEAQALAMANDSVYGLGGSVFSAERERAVEFARRVQSGTLGVNSYTPDISAPFGGYKASGLGREYGPEAVEAFSHLKSIYVPVA
jgi:acyl-CoA reductase-like NAD-dependent aldehyde dehydrogenase